MRHCAYWVLCILFFAVPRNHFRFITIEKEFMQCPYCSSELESDVVECKQCGATKISRRTTVGIFVGWAGMVIGLMWIMLWFPLLFLPFVGYDVRSYPWITLIVGTIIAAALLWYSRSTVHSEWIRPED